MSDTHFPPGWRFENLGDVTRIVIGKTPSRNVPQFWNGDLPWATIADLNDGVLVDTAEKITRMAVEVERTRLFPKGTILYSFKLTLGKMAVAGTDLFTNEAIAGITPRDSQTLDNDFLWFALKSVDPLQASSHAVKGRTLNQEGLHNLKIPVPPLDEQRRRQRARQRKSSCGQQGSCQPRT